MRIGRNIYKSLNQFRFQFIQSKGSPLLGSGTFAKIMLARHIQTNQIFALKIVPIHDQIQLKNRNKLEVNLILNQIAIHMEIKHKNIVQMYDAFHQNNLIVMVLQYCQKFSLYQSIKNQTKFSEQKAFKYFRQTLQAIYFLHQKDILHRDIKPQNLLLDREGHVKLCDFGYSLYGLHKQNKYVCGTYEYMAKEILCSEGYNYKVDIWSLGILLFEMIEGAAPYTGKRQYSFISTFQVKKKIKQKIHFSLTTSKEAKQLILNMLNQDPAKRPDIIDIAEAKWIKKMQKVTKQSLILQQKRQRKKIFNKQKQNSIPMLSNMILDKNKAIFQQKSYISQQSVFSPTKTFRDFNAAELFDNSYADRRPIQRQQIYSNQKLSFMSNAKSSQQPLKLIQSGRIKIRNISKYCNPYSSNELSMPKTRRDKIIKEQEHSRNCQQFFC